MNQSTQPVKTRSSVRTKTATAEKTPVQRVTYSTCIRVLGRTRDRVLLTFKGGSLGRPGGTPDTWQLRATREAMADALSRAEDWLELAHPKWPERAALAEVRRRLELELWP